MKLHQQQLLLQIETALAVELDIKAEFTALIMQHENCLERSNLQAHITASALVLSDSSQPQVLLVNHKKLSRWLQPGGHADGNANVLAVAQQEVLEETGLETMVLCSQVFDLDRHYIPEHKNVSAHWHYDFRFILQADFSAPLCISHESTDVAWWSLDRLVGANIDASLQRLIVKAQSLNFL